MMKPVDLSSEDRAILNGEQGDAMAFAMRVVVRAAEILQAPYLIDASFVHVDACHYYGQVHLDFARFFVDERITFSIPAWTNTVPVNLMQPEIRIPADPVKLKDARTLANLYVSLGCKPVWTCAPYQLPGGPEFGDQIIGSESNAVAYYNSVVGARTNKYGDFLDVCTGLVGRVPFAGLHTDSGRVGQILFDISPLPLPLRESEVFCHVLGHLLGKASGSKIPVVQGLPQDVPKDSLKAISAAAAASGGVAMFHGVGVTPEATTIQQAFGGPKPPEPQLVTMDQVIKARDELSSAGPGPLNMVALGTPHFSANEFERLVTVLDGRKIHPDTTCYVSTSRFVSGLIKQMGWLDELEKAGIHVIVDTCTYFTPAVKACRGRVMTNSAKWAYYAPGMLDVEVAFGSLEDCVASAVKGEVVRETPLWGDR